jgi:hypothetical protein
MHKGIVAFFGLLAVSAIDQASANTLVDTIGSDTFNSGSNGGSGSGISQVTGQSVAMEFAVGGDSLITSVKAYIVGNGTNQIELGLMLASGPDDLPSGTFVAGDVQNVSLSNIDPVDLTSLNWAVTPGFSPYWLVAVANPGGSGIWLSSSTAINSWDRGNGTGSGWLVADMLSEPPEAIVQGSAVAVTPLPAALPLFATGLGGLGLLGWRRKRKAAALSA